MSYITPEYIQFFEELEKNNNKEWFDQHRSQYETFVKKPFEQLVVDLGERISTFDAEINTDFKKCIFRINKDIRFSKDKSPYKLNRSAAYSKYGKKDHNNPGYYIQIGAKEAYFAGGAWNPPNESLHKIRKEIYYDTAEFNQIVNDKTFIKNFGEIHGEKAKRLVNEERDWAQESPYIYYKQFYFWKKFDVKDTLKDNFVEQTAEKFKTALPFLQFLRRAMNEMD